MGTIIYYFVTIAAVIFVVQKIFYWLALLQSNNFQFKRTYINLRKKKELASLFFGWENIVHLLLVLLYFVTLIESRSSVFYSFSVSIFFALYFIVISKHFLRGRVKLPHFNLEILTIALLVLFISIFLFMFPLLDDFFWYLFIAKLIPVFVIVTVWFVSIPKDFYKDYLNIKNFKRIKEYKDLKKIVVIGDNINTELNTILYYMLSQKFNVVYGQRNATIFEIAKTISKKVNKDTDILIVDVIFSNPEELIEIIQTLEPSICLINFLDSGDGSQISKRLLNNLMLVLPKSSIVLSLGENTNSSSQISNKQNYYVLTYKSKQKKIKSYFSKNVVIHKTFMSFILVFPNGHEIRLKTKIINPKSINGLVSSAAVAKILEFSNLELASSIENLLPITNQLQYAIHKKGFVMVCDPNSSMDFDSEDFLKQVRGVTGKRIIIFSIDNQIEGRSKKFYLELGKRISKLGDIIIVTNFENSYFKSGIASHIRKKFLHFLSHEEVIAYVNTSIKKNDLCVFIGDSANTAFLKIKSSDIINK